VVFVEQFPDCEAGYLGEKLPLGRERGADRAVDVDRQRGIGLGLPLRRRLGLGAAPFAALGRSGARLEICEALKVGARLVHDAHAFFVGHLIHHSTFVIHAIPRLSRVAHDSGHRSRNPIASV
jgi:hypothetical protein